MLFVIDHGFGHLSREVFRVLSTSTSIYLLGKTVRHRAEGVHRAVVRLKTACVSAVSHKSLDKICVGAICD